MASVAATLSRPSLVTDAIQSNGKIYYFGCGSNLLKEKLINRGVNGTKINFESFEPGKVEGYRLAFNLICLPPLEPVMAGIEPSDCDECHGSLVYMSIVDYDNLWRSESGASKAYFEEVVEVTPYHAAQSHDGSDELAGVRKVKAIALRASAKVKRDKDGSPSARYMKLLIDGAESLGLTPAYIDKLKAIKPENPSQLMAWLGRSSLTTVSILFKLKLLPIVRLQSRFLSLIYCPECDDQASPMRKSRKILSNILIALYLLPSAVIGLIIRGFMKAFKIKPPTLWESAACTEKPIVVGTAETRANKEEVTAPAEASDSSTAMSASSTANDSSTAMPASLTASDTSTTTSVEPKAQT